MSWFRNTFSTISHPMKVLLVILVIILVIAIQAGGMTYYMLYLQDQVSTVELVRVKHDLPSRYIITEQDVELARVRVEDAVKGYISSIQDVIGLEVREPLAEREQLTIQKIGEPIKKPDEVTIEIPNGWIASYPQSLRSWDKVSIWVVPDDSKQNRMAEETGLVMETRPILEDITVAYFKDNSSNDVQDVSSTVPRTSATAVGARIELNVTQEQLSLLLEKYHEGYKFIIGY